MGSQSQAIQAWWEALTQGRIQGHPLHAHPPATGPSPLWVLLGKGVLSEKREGQRGHRGVFLLQSFWARHLLLLGIPPWLAPAWLQASLCPRGLCDLGPARQWGRGTGKLSPCGQVPSGQIS